MIGAPGLILMFISALLIAGADVLIKYLSEGRGFLQAATHPLMMVVFGSYVAQILIVIYVFLRHGELAIYANIFIVFYSILMVLAGVLLFRENLSVTQYIGIVLALIGALLLNKGV